MDPIVFLSGQISEVKEEAASVARAQLAVDLAAITILIDKGIVTHEEAAQRIERLHSKLKGDQEHPTAGAIVELAAQFLRAHAPQVGHGWNPIVHEGGRKESESED